MYKKKYHIYFPPFLHSPYSAQQAPSTSCIFFNHPLDPVSIAHICMDGQSLPLYRDYSTGDCVLKKKKKKTIDSLSPRRSQLSGAPQYRVGLGDHLCQLWWEL